MTRKDRQRRDKWTLCNTASTAIGAAGAVLASEALYVVLTTPRLNPPPLSGTDFESDGILVVHCDNESNNDHNDIADNNHNTYNKELRVILLGDSPVEGIGNETHQEALAGQTAKAISDRYKQNVRFWSFGKSGLTAHGIEQEIVPLMKQIQMKFGRIDLVVLSCGVNNVLWGHSAVTFGKELESLLDSIEQSPGHTTSMSNGSLHSSLLVPDVIVMALLDFSYMPFLPYPLSSFAGWRSRALQKEMEHVIQRRNIHKIDSKNNNNPNDTSLHVHVHVHVGVTIAHIPDISTVLMQEDHPLLEDIETDVKRTLQLENFFADDGFHPAKYGTILLGKLISQTYDAMMKKKYET